MIHNPTVSGGGKVDETATITISSNRTSVYTCSGEVKTNGFFEVPKGSIIVVDRRGGVAFTDGAELIADAESLFEPTILLINGDCTLS